MSKGTNEISQIEEILTDLLKKVENLRSEELRNKEELEAKLEDINNHYDNLISETKKREDELPDIDKAISIIEEERKEKIELVKKGSEEKNNLISEEKRHLYTLSKYYLNKYRILANTEKLRKLNEDIVSQEDNINSIVEDEISSLSEQIQDIILKIESLKNQMESVDSDYKDNKKEIDSDEEAAANNYISKFGEGVFIIPDEDSKEQLIRCIQSINGIPTSILNKCKEYTFKEAIGESIGEQKKKLSSDYIESLESLDEEIKSLEIEKKKLEERKKDILSKSNKKIEDLSDNRLNYISKEKRAKIEEALENIAKLRAQIKETEEENIKYNAQMKEHSDMVKRPAKKTDDDAPSY